MKTFTYVWDDDYFLLHLQLNKRKGQSFQMKMIRNFNDGNTRNEYEDIKSDSDSHRFLVARTHPKEISFYCEYPEDTVLEAFKLDDRAYYPTESFYKN